MFGETVTVLRMVETTTDRYGRPVQTWPEPGVDVDGCAVAPRTSTEPAQVGRQGVITGVTVYLPAGTAIGPHDRVRARGVVYDVEGEPGDWRNPYSGRTPGIEVALTRHEG